MIAHKSSALVRATIFVRDLETGPWNLQVAGKNLTQEEGWQTGFGFSVIQPRFIIEPRTWLATLRYSF